LLTQHLLISDTTMRWFEGASAPPLSYAESPNK